MGANGVLSLPKEFLKFRLFRLMSLVTPFLFIDLFRSKFYRSWDFNGSEIIDHMRITKPVKQIVSRYSH